jgi:hypothetical protein
LFAIHDPQIDAYTQISGVAVGVFQVPDMRGPQIHVGFVYRNLANQMVYSDLAMHYRFRHGFAQGSNFFWIESKLDSRLQYDFMVWLEAQSRRNNDGKVPWSIDCAGCEWDAQLRLTSTKMGRGLTCATFITSALETFGYPLIDVATWPKRPSRQDKRWQRRIMKTLKLFAPAEHVAAQKILIGKVARFRPDDIAAAFGEFEGIPLAHDETKVGAKAIREAVKLKEKPRKPFFPSQCAMG